MPLTEWQGSLNSVTFGTGTNYRFDERGGIAGIGVPTPKSHDVDLKSGDGAYSGADRKSVRIITIPFVVLGTSPSDAMDNFQTLCGAFVEQASDITLELYLPGNHFTVAGRPRGLNEDLSRLKASVIPCLARFDALTPTMTLI
jgi:hypothetical protein